MTEIVIVDDLGPEAVAMVQALYSRDPRSVKTHLLQVRTRGADKFMASFYVGYGHKSIGDCGTTSIFVENVSMLVTKAVQDWPLYSGQEASTRYLDMATQPVRDPVATPESKFIQEEWIRFYQHVLRELIVPLKARFPIQPGEKDAVYDKAIKARAFDIARGFLPAGVTTFAAWHTNLRQAYDHIKEMRHHPLAEVKETAELILHELKKKYPSSFSHKEYPAEEAYLAKSMTECTYYDDDECKVNEFTVRSMLDLKGLAKHQKLLAERPPRCELHQRLRQYGNLQFSFPLDFGSYRDLQRHRSLVQEMPLLTTRHGFYSWYLEQLPDELRKEAMSVIAAQEKRIAALETTPESKQYYIAMGYTVTAKITGGLPAMVYTAELRSTDTVHPTLRLQAQKMGEAIQTAVPGIAVHCDHSPGSWNIKRGHQDIVPRVPIA